MGQEGEFSCLLTKPTRVNVAIRSQDKKLFVERLNNPLSFRNQFLVQFLTGSGSKLKYPILIQELTDFELVSVCFIDRKRESYRGQMKKIIEFFKNHGGYARMKDFRGVDQFRPESGLPLAGKSS